MDFGLLLLVVFFCSIIQSLFGIGILVFGTPLLMFFGYPFDVVLLYILPCSIVVSAFQVSEGWRKLGKEKRVYLVYLLPTLVLGLVAVLTFSTQYDARIFVGILLVVSGLLRSSKFLSKHLSHYLVKHREIFLGFIGLVHGTTNMGGSLLTIYCTSVYNKKESIRSHIAFVYLFMASIQLILLFLFVRPTIEPLWFVSPVVAGLTYKIIGLKLFNVSSDVVYQKLITGFILLFGIVLLLR